ncbi:MAG TPA: DUF4202 domain-containing protein [Pseudolabrys sp.]|jgi:hypothetical protein|nr:DUF4202 domain-containing protein [Pseudolabrys sp.]
MAGPNERLFKILSAIDATNACDPRMVEFDGRQEPVELIYGKRMTETLARIVPEPSECLQIAVRGQHIERWKIARATYPVGRAGYLQWRRVQRDHQALRIGELMAAVGYDADAIERLGVLIRKEKIKTDAEVQLLEDIICVTFLQYYLPDFSTKVDEDKLADILAKTWGRMSEIGHQHALKLDLPPNVLRLLKRGLAQLNSKG